MKYYTLFFSLFVLLMLSVSTSLAQSQSAQVPTAPAAPIPPARPDYQSLVPDRPTPPTPPPIPDKPGIYDDPADPSIKVEVFVYEPKEALTGTSTTCTDPDSSAVDGKTGWKLPSSMIYSLNLYSVPTSVGSSNLPTIAKNAYAAWQNAVGGKVVFTRGTDTYTNTSQYDRRNIVAWGTVSNSSALAVTYTRYYQTTGQVVDVDTIFNKNFTWKWTNPATSTCSLYTSAYDVQNILTHELGHWMGLADHYTSTYTNNTMYGYGSVGEVKKDTLATGDKTGVLSIYR